MPGAAVLDVPADGLELIAHSVEAGWGDGLPLVPPTPQLVDDYVAASGLARWETLGSIPPLMGDCTVELVAINAIMAGAPAKAMPLILASLRALLTPTFDIGGINATTNSVIPALVVNGPVRHELDIPFQHAAFGGVAGSAPAIGRAVRLAMRNIGGQRAGVTSEGVFGQPSRTTGIVVGEWEENSPWEPLSVRRGVTGSAVTAFAAVGNTNIVDASADTGRELLELIGKSLAYLGNTNMSPASSYSQQLVAINPIWANERIARDIPSIEDVQQIIWEAARVPLAWYPTTLVPHVEERGRIDRDGNVYLMEQPDEVLVFVAGGLGNLHAMMLPGFAHFASVTVPVLG